MSRKIDILVAEHIFKLHLRPYHSVYKKADGSYEEFTEVKIVGKNDRGINIPPYSTDISTAWELVEKYDLAVIKDGCMYSAGVLNSVVEGYSPEVLVDAETAPLAICMAALKLEETLSGTAILEEQED